MIHDIYICIFCEVGSRFSFKSYLRSQIGFDLLGQNEISFFSFFWTGFFNIGSASCNYIVFLNFHKILKQ